MYTNTVNLNQDFDLEKFYLKQLVDGLPEFLFWKDKNSVFLGCNKNFAQLAGLSCPADIIGKTDYDLPWSKDESDMYRADDLEIIQSGKGKCNIEETQTIENGIKKTLLTNKVPLYDQHGNIAGVVGIYSNITELKNTQIKLKEEKIKAESSSRAKTEFLANMSHDVKSPLLSINILANTLLDSVDEDNKKNVELILFCQKQLSTFFKNCLDNSSYELESPASSEEAFSTEALMIEIYNLFITTATEKKLSFVLDIDDDAKTIVIGHRFVLLRIIMNLVSNALKFTETGGIMIKATKTVVDDNHIIFSIAVQDSGLGIPEDKQHIIFERLSRLASAFSKRIEGSGIGLYIVDQYVKRLNGAIDVKSRVGEGSTFTVSVPLKLVKKNC